MSVFGRRSPMILDRDVGVGDADVSDSVYSISALSTPRTSSTRLGACRKVARQLQRFESGYTIQVPVWSDEPLEWEVGKTVLLNRTG